MLQSPSCYIKIPYCVHFLFTFLDKVRGNKASYGKTKPLNELGRAQSFYVFGKDMGSAFACLPSSQEVTIST